METITIQIFQHDVYDEVAKATDYTGAKLIDGDEKARDRILAADDDLATLDRFWEESVMATNERFKQILVSGTTRQFADKTVYEGILEVSRAFDKTLTESIQSTIRSFFIASIIGQWFKFANKGEASDYFAQGAELIEAAERMLYSRKRPALPKD